jgi:hypothetical protein
MAAYRREMVIDDPNRVVLSDLPFQRGDRVEITIEKEIPKPTSRIEEWDELFRETDRCPEIRRLTEEEVAEEIAHIRAGQ